ncbi:phosphopentomutase [Magnetococcus marinus MC-1]|uniref:Phosphopentomutase n=1 Tax=Magnetococcus marinus (strain ATCC BAA-1437 / JCM 17883 / MC-1) TaxID=156889 RepID=A0LAF3_MAGMM|nr:phosphopentomutase [Magnetococcus marinus]ABK44946.1 phosphopentomutase [Magnetococcus marinus MC-1]
MKRVAIVVIDSMGIGAMPDAAAYGDRASCNTLGNVARHNHGLSLPHLQSLGLGNLLTVAGVPAIQEPLGCFGRLLEASQGKDTTTGHWEMAGLVLDKPFKVYPEGFPQALMQAFVEQSGCGGYLGNIPASGTAIIEEHHQRHCETGYPIIYTSADSVFQIACNVDVVPLQRLYAWCETARALLTDHYNVSRVIARPYRPVAGGLQRLSADRRDYSVKPPYPSLLDKVLQNKGQVIAIGKIEDIFVGSGISHAIHTGSNQEGLLLTQQALAGELDLDGLAVEGATNGQAAQCALIFTNLVDTDMLHGHRNDAKGYGQALEEIDRHLGRMLPLLGPDDLLIITADHGCDPTEPGTDHTREMVPLLTYSPGGAVGRLEDRGAFTHIAHLTAEWLGFASESHWIR